MGITTGITDIEAARGPSPLRHKVMLVMTMDDGKFYVAPFSVLL